MFRQGGVREAAGWELFIATGNKRVEQWRLLAAQHPRPAEALSGHVLTEVTSGLERLTVIITQKISNQIKALPPSPGVWLPGRWAAVGRGRGRARAGWTASRSPTRWSPETRTHCRPPAGHQSARWTSWVCSSPGVVGREAGESWPGPSRPPAVAAG